MSKMLIRPPPRLDDSEDDSDEDDEDLIDDDDDEEDEEEMQSSKRKRSDGGGKKRKKAKNKGASSFFDIEAEASDDEDEEEDEGGEIDGERMDAEAREMMLQQDRRRAQAGRFLNRSVDEISRDIELRHQMQNRRVDARAYAPPPRARPPPPAKPASKAAAAAAVVAKPAARMPPPEPAMAPPPLPPPPVEYDEGGGPEAYGAVAQQSLLPSVSDPSLWMVSCSTGKEQELVLQIMNKCVAAARQHRPLGICGVIAAQSKGKIYIESFSEPAVKEAMEGVRGLMLYTLRLVPIGDMTTVMTVKAKKLPIRKNEMVRMTRGHYKGDLALVVEVKESGTKCIVRCVPRLDLVASDMPPEEARVRRRTVRPPQKFFNPQDVAAMGKQVLSRTRFPGTNFYCDYFETNYFHEGYMLKELTVGTMIKTCTDEDPPTLEELQRFQKRQTSQDNYDDGEDQTEANKAVSSLLDELSDLQKKAGVTSGGSGHGLLIGDTVEVIEGDLISMRGKLISLDGTTVKIKPFNASDLGGTDEIEFLANQVRKYIPVGAHVKVTDGRYANETGTVVAIEKLDGDSDFTAVVLTDITSKEISVRTSQLRESAEIASGQDKLQGYELYDLVVLSGGGSTNEVGVIVRVGREDFTVINNHGISREVRPEELRGKRNSTSQRAVALDVQGSQIRCGDTVNVVEGPHKGKSATIKRMSRAQLFLHSQTRSEHAGIFVVRSRSCVLAGAKSQNSRVGGDSAASPFATPQSQQRGGPVAAKGRRDDGLVGKTVRIQAGNWKGYLGVVTDATATHVQVELHSRHKKVMVIRERTIVVGDKFGATEDATRIMPPAENQMQLAPTTPFVAAGMTPMHGGATPMHGMMDAGDGDEVWRPGGAVDQDGIKDEDDGWGVSASDTNAIKNDADDGWGTDTKVPVAAVKQETGFAIKNEPKNEPKSEIEDDGEEVPPWFMERVMVTVKSTQMRGYIKELRARTALVQYTDGQVGSFRASELAMVSPGESSNVLVTGGTDIGLEGVLVCIDGNDAILKDASEDFKIVDLSFLAEVHHNAHDS